MKIWIIQITLAAVLSNNFPILKMLLSAKLCVNWIQVVNSIPTPWAQNCVYSKTLWEEKFPILTSWADQGHVQVTYKFFLSKKQSLFMVQSWGGSLNVFMLIWLIFFPGRCYEDGVDSVGNDIKDFSVSSIEECQNECKKVFNCKLFVYAPSIKNCWLKHTPATRSLNSDRIVGPKVCTGFWLCYFFSVWEKLNIWKYSF